MGNLQCEIESVSPGERRVAGKKRMADKFAADLRPIVERLKRDGHTSLWSLARALNLAGIATPRAAEWHASSVRNLLFRLDRLAVADGDLDDRSRAQAGARRVSADQPCFCAEQRTSPDTNSSGGNVVLLSVVKIAAR